MAALEPTSVRTLPERVADAIGPALAAAAGPLWEPLIQALAAELAATDELVTVPDGPLAAAPLFNLATSPYPHVLGQVVGLRVPASLSVDDARRYVAGRGVSRRGTPTALKTAAAQELTGTRRVDLVERDGTPWRVRLITYAAETPDPAAVRTAALAEKPIGIVLTHEVAPGMSWDQIDAEHLTWTQVEAMTIDELGGLIPHD